MCHDTSTADRFYSLVLDRGQASKLRQQFEAVMSAPDTSHTPASAVISDGDMSGNSDGSERYSLAPAGFTDDNASTSGRGV